VIAHKQFILQFHRVIQGKDSFLWNSKKGEHKTIMDIAPYSTDQCIRCINQSKMSNNFLLKNDNIDPIDSLIRLYWGVGDRRMIEFNEGEGLIKSRGISDKKRKTKQQQAQETDVMELYETEGITLMEAKELTYTDLRVTRMEAIFESYTKHGTKSSGIYVYRLLLTQLRRFSRRLERMGKIVTKIYTRFSNSKFSIIPNGRESIPVVVFKDISTKSTPVLF